MHASVKCLLLTLCAVATLGTASAQTKPRFDRADPEKCPAMRPLPSSQIVRSKPIPLHKSVARLAKSTRDRLAVLSLAGEMICVDIRPAIDAGNPVFSADWRFTSFAWRGVEADGYILIDRSGTGQLIDTGGQPIFSPSRQRFAAVHQSETAFSALEGLGIWQVGPTGTRLLTMLNDIPEMVDWKIDKWVGEECIEMSAIPFSRAPAGTVTYANLQRDKFVAQLSGSRWRVARDNTC